MFSGQGHHDHVTVVSKTEASVTEDAALGDDAVAATAGSPDFGSGKPVVGGGCLGHMLHNNSSRGRLPAYSSWSLTCLGSYSSYNPSAGEC